MNTMFAAVLAAVTFADGYRRPSFNFGEGTVVYAAPGLECNIYYESCFDSVNPRQFAFIAESQVGRSLNRSWTWTPTKADAGRRERVVLNAWSDDGIVAAATVTVQVAALEADPERKFACAVLGDSLVGSRYQDRVRDAVRDYGWKGYTDIGTKGGNAYGEKDVDRGGTAARHDGFGGWTAGSFLSSYLLTIDEVKNIQDEGEKEMLAKFQSKVDEAELRRTHTEWRKGLMKSPFIRIVNGQKDFRVQYWLDAVNGGEPPDFVMIELGINGTCAFTDANVEAGCRRTAFDTTKRLIDAIRARCPDTVIGLASCIPGCDQNAFGKGYGAKQIWAVQCHKNMFRLNYYYRKLVEEYRAMGDMKVQYVPVGQAVDPWYGYPTVQLPANAHSPEKETRLNNGVHPNAVGGRQMGDAFAAWILNNLK